MSTSNRKPPIRCIPCRVTYNGQRYQIESNGSVRFVPPVLAFPKGFEDTIKSYQVVRGLYPEPESIAKLVRREASRQRRNRNARERNQAMRDLGMTKTPHGWE